MSSINMIKQAKPGISHGGMDDIRPGDKGYATYMRSKKTVKSAVKSPPTTPANLKGMGSYKRKK